LFGTTAASCSLTIRSGERLQKKKCDQESKAALRFSGLGRLDQTSAVLGQGFPLVAGKLPQRDDRIESPFYVNVNIFAQANADTGGGLHPPAGNQFKEASCSITLCPK